MGGWLVVWRVCGWSSCWVGWVFVLGVGWVLVCLLYWESVSLCGDIWDRCLVFCWGVCWRWWVCCFRCFRLCWVVVGFSCFCLGWRSWLCEWWCVRCVYWLYCWLLMWVWCWWWFMVWCCDVLCGSLWVWLWWWCWLGWLGCICGLGVFDWLWCLGRFCEVSWWELRLGFLVSLVDLGWWVGVWGKFIDVVLVVYIVGKCCC